MVNEEIEISFLSVTQQHNSGLRLLIAEVPRSHTPGRTPLNEWSARRWVRYLHNTQQTKETNINAISGIRTRNPSGQPTAEIRLRRHGHRDRHTSRWRV